MGTKRAARVRAKGLAPIPLPSELALDLEVFCAANYNAEKGEIIRNALRFFIDVRLDAEPEMRKRFIEKKALLNKKPGTVVPIRPPDPENPD